MRVLFGDVMVDQRVVHIFLDEIAEFLIGHVPELTLSVDAELLALSDDVEGDYGSACGLRQMDDINESFGKIETY